MAKKRIGELIKHGAPRYYYTILTALSRKGYWHHAKTLSTNCGLSNAHLEKLGLTSIKTLWIGIHSPAKAQYFLRNAPCGPACGVLWGGTVNYRPLPDQGSVATLNQFLDSFSITTDLLGVAIVTGNAILT